MCNLCANLLIKVRCLEDALTIANDRLSDITGDLTLPFKGLDLTGTELRALNFLVNTPGYVSHRAVVCSIYEDPYADDAPGDDIVRTIIYDIRPKLAVFGLTIETKIGCGYYLRPEVRARLLALRTTLMTTPEQEPVHA